MKIGLASDSFGNTAGLRFALERLSAAGAERIFFLGGRYADVDAALGLAAAAPPGDGGLEFLQAVEGALAGRPRGSSEEARRLAGRIVRVASRGCPEYLPGRAPGKVFELVNGLICCLVHDKSELSREDIANASVLFHGNSGRPALVAIGPRTFVTPGRLRALEPGGAPATFALLDVDGSNLELIAFATSGEEMKRERASIAGRSKVSVR